MTSVCRQNWSDKHRPAAADGGRAMESARREGARLPAIRSTRYARSWQDALPDLTYRRRPAGGPRTLAALVACVLFPHHRGPRGTRPPILYGPVALAIAVLGVVLKRNPSTVCALTPNTWEITTNGAERAILRADLAAVRFHDGRTGRPR